MELLFLGTSAGVPTRSRNVTAILLNLQHPTQAGLWLFDCGEGTQHQMLTTPFNPENSIVFYQPSARRSPVWFTGTTVQSLNGRQCPASDALRAKRVARVYRNRIASERLWTDYPMEIVEITAGEIVDDGLRKVTAYPLAHPLECYGFRIQEHDKPGALDANALKAAGVKAGPWFQDLKAGKPSCWRMDVAIHGADFFPRPPATGGKSVAIFGDTGPCASAIELARGVDVMVHETTLDASMEEKPTVAGTAQPDKPHSWRWMPEWDA